ncbi:MAG: SsrA-binding protein SmpB [candidate division Zixibacteria bacterium]|nr:SsrA-binding protein SmpB [candidate division Zixibacteria bacterium]
MADKEEIRYVVRNRKARHDYEIKSSLEVGIELQGSEVKSIREGKVNLSDAYATVENGEVILKNLHISAYKMARENHDPLRPRRLLLHKREIRKMTIQTEQRGMTLVPLSVYFRGRNVKIELAVAVGRKKYDKRQAIARQEASRRIKKALKRDL